MIRSRFSVALTLVVLLLLGGCGSSYNRMETGGTDRIHMRLDPSVAVLVTTPQDGGWHGKIADGSGALVARRVDAAFSRYARLVDVTPTPYRSLDALKDQITKNGYGYIVVPTILVWSGKESTWSKRPDQVHVKIAVLDAETGTEISSTFLESKTALSSYDLFDTDSANAGPEKLLADMLDDYSDDLYGATLPFLH